MSANDGVVDPTTVSRDISPQISCRTDSRGALCVDEVQCKQPNNPTWKRNLARTRN